MGKLTLRLPEELPGVHVAALHARHGDPLEEGAVVVTLRLGEHDYVVTSPRPGRLLPLARPGDELSAGDALFALHLGPGSPAGAEVEEAKLRLPVGRYRPGAAVAEPAHPRESGAGSPGRRPAAAASPDALRQRVAARDPSPPADAAGESRGNGGRRSARLAVPLAGFVALALAGLALLHVSGWERLPWQPVRLDGPPPSARAQVPPAHPRAVVSSPASGVRDGRRAAVPESVPAAPVRQGAVPPPDGAPVAVALPPRPAGRLSGPSPVPAPAPEAGLPAAAEALDAPPAVREAAGLGEPPPERPGGRRIELAAAPAAPRRSAPAALPGAAAMRQQPGLSRSSSGPPPPFVPVADRAVRLTAESPPSVPRSPAQPRRSGPTALGEPAGALPPGSSPNPAGAVRRDGGGPIRAEARAVPRALSGATGPPVSFDHRRLAGIGSAHVDAGSGSTAPVSGAVAASEGEVALRRPGEGAPPDAPAEGQATGAGSRAAIARGPQPLAHSALLTATAPFGECGPFSFAGPDPLPPGDPIRVSGSVASAGEAEEVRQGLAGLDGNRSLALDLTVVGEIVCRIERLLPSENAPAVGFRFGYGGKNGTAAQAVYFAGENPVVDVTVDRAYGEGWLYVFYIDGASGRVIRLLPHADRPENRVAEAGSRGEQGYRVRILYAAEDVGPGRRGFLVGPPYGTSLLLAVASARKLPEAKLAGSGSAERFVRDLLDLVSRTERHAIARRFFTTSPE